MKKVELLDCTLRDGGRIIDCKFKDRVIDGISDDLTNAGIDIVELGFLRDKNKIKYEADSTFFTDLRQMDRFVKDDDISLYCAFIDYGMYDFDDLCDKSETKISAIRVGFTKKDYNNDFDSVRKALELVKTKGYKLFVQGVNTPGYTDAELLNIIDTVNQIKPYSFGIVDTYGSLYLEDLTYIYNLVERNLDNSIRIDIHSHNNFQSSFAFAQEVLRVSSSDRIIVLDATLNGMGKCAGNLNTELIVDYLNRKKGKSYDLDIVLDCIDTYLLPLKKDLTWGYSVPAFMAGIYRAHPNNIIYLTEKYRLSSKDIRHILSKIDDNTRQRYDYDNIQRIYHEYSSDDVDDSEAIKLVQSVINDRKVLIVAPGKSITEYENQLICIANEKDVVAISVNYVPDKINTDYLFCANALHWNRLKKTISPDKCIVTSNVKEEIQKTIYINYESYLGDGDYLADNSVIMLLNFLYKCGAKEIMLAGFDGIQSNTENYATEEFINSSHGLSAEKNNEYIRIMYQKLLKKVKDKMKIAMITPSLFEPSVKDE